MKLEAELEYVLGISMAFLQKCGGVHIKPSLEDYKPLKLYDAEKRFAGEVWMKLSVRIKVLEVVPAE